MLRWIVLAACLFAIGALGYRDAVRSPHAKALGGSCDSSYDCKQGTRCESDGVLAGQCSAACNASSSCAEAFGADSQCIGADLCAHSCKSQSECPAQTHCNGYGWCERVERPD